MIRDSIAKFFKVDSLISNLTGYIEARLELLKVEAKEELSKGLSAVLVFLLLAFVFALFIVFISVGIALKIGEDIGNLAGFGIVAGFYLLTGAGLFIYREKLGKKIEMKISDLFKKKKQK
jgi:uncharacterized membrane protein YqjE